MEPTPTPTDGIATLRTVALERLTWARRFTHGLLEGMSDEQLVARAAGRGNHALWVIGHLAVVDDNLASLFANKPKRLPADFAGLFAPGSQPTDRAADYPARAELLATAAAMRQRFAEWVGSLTAETAFLPSPSMLRRFSPDRITTAFAVVAHEMLHNGQIAAVRSSLGLPKMLV